MGSPPRINTNATPKIAGPNLVINRKSLNVESKRATDKKIQQENLMLLNRLQGLKGSYAIKSYISEHKKRAELVERISNYPLVLNHNARKLN